MILPIVNSALVALIDDEDAWRFEGRRIYLSGRRDFAYPAVRNVGRQGVTVIHAELLGKLPRGVGVDHINGDRFDNRRSNLRVADQTINNVNRHQLSKNNTTGVRGIYYINKNIPNRWSVQICVRYKRIYVGLFATKEKAQAARRDAERQYFGRVCPTNEVHP